MEQVSQHTTLTGISLSVPAKAAGTTPSHPPKLENANSHRASSTHVVVSVGVVSVGVVSVGIVSKKYNINTGISKTYSYIEKRLGIKM